MLQQCDPECNYYYYYYYYDCVVVVSLWRSVDCRVVVRDEHREGFFLFSRVTRRRRRRWNVEYVSCCSRRRCSFWLYNIIYIYMNLSRDGYSSTYLLVLWLSVFGKAREQKVTKLKGCCLNSFNILYSFFFRTNIII